MEYMIKKGTIHIDDFTRESIMESTTGYINKSNVQLKLQSIDEYIDYVSHIDSFSNVYYNITKICNLKCSYCYSENHNSWISLEDNQIILNLISKLKTNTITLIGGEPFCHPYFYKILKAVIKMKDINEICIVTNGTLIDKSFIKLFSNPKVELQISLDSIHEEVNSKTRGKKTLEKVIKNIKLLHDNNINVKVMQVLTSENANSAFEFFNYFADLGIPSGFFMVKLVDEKLKPSISQLKNLLDRLFYNKNLTINEIFETVCFADNMLFGNEGFPVMHCGAGISSLSINPNGDVFPCVKRSKSQDKITNFLENDDALIRIKENKNLLINTDLVIYKDKCKECSTKFFCGGGCRAEEKNNSPCDFNCDYFNFALQYYYKRLYEEPKNIDEGNFAL